MSDHRALCFRHQRYRERLGSTQRLDDKLLCVLTDGQGLECLDGHLAYRGNIAGRFVPNNDL